MIILTRRALLGAGAAALGVRIDTIRFALAEDAGRALETGVRFGLRDAGRAMTLMGRRLELAPRADVVVRKDAAIQVENLVYSLRPEPAAYEAVVRAAREARAVSTEARAVEWHHSLRRYGASELNARFARDAGARMDPEHWLGWMAVKIIAEGSLRAQAGESLVATLARARFDGHKGVALAFTTESRRLQQPLYVVDTTRDAVVWPI